MSKLALWGLSAALLAGCASEQAKVAPVAPVAPAAPAPTVAAAPKPAAAPVARTDAPKPVPAIPSTDPKSILAKRSVFYDFDTYTIKPEFRPMVEAHARYVTQHSGSSVMIEGNGDERGSREYNLALGQRRADGVKSLMILLGAPERQIETVSFGEEKPQAAGHDETSWAQNRRSDIVYKREQ
jgi:peptidoglycan-associated lipoprotein